MQLLWIFWILVLTILLMRSQTHCLPSLGLSTLICTMGIIIATWEGCCWDQVTGKGWREWHAEGINESYLSLRFAAFQRKNENYKAHGLYTNSIFNILIKEMCFIYHYSHLIVYRLVMCNLSRTLPPIVWFVLWVFLVISLLS